MNIHLFLNVEVLAAVTITEACTDAKRLATLTGLLICFDFNGVQMNITSKCDIAKEVEIYSKQLMEKIRHDSSTPH